MAIATGLPPFLKNLIQTNYLQRLFLEALKPKTLYRAEAMREKMTAEQGQTVTMTRRGLAQPNIAPLAPGFDPNPNTYTLEQFTVAINQYGGTQDTDLQASSIAISNKFIQDAQSLAEMAGWTLDRLNRNALYQAYVGGDTNVLVATTTSNQILVASLNGFSTVTDANGVQQAVSSNFPLSVTINGVANTVIGAVPADANFPLGYGTLTLGTSISATLRWRVLAVNRPYIQYPTGVTTGLDGIAAANVLDFPSLIAARARLEADRVPKFADGTYHVHLDPDHLKHLLNDTAFRQLYQGAFQSTMYVTGRMVQQLGLTFFDNTDNPKPGNISLALTSSYLTGQAGSNGISQELGCELVNSNGTGIELRRSIMLGMRSLSEFYIDEAQYRDQMVSAPGPMDIIGFQGTFQEESPGFITDLANIRYIVRPPMDKKMQVVSQSWTFTGGWVAPSDERSVTSKARLKRAVVLVTSN
jgi:hypothetical protein